MIEIPRHAVGITMITIIIEHINFVRIIILREKKATLNNLSGKSVTDP